MSTNTPIYDTTGLVFDDLIFGGQDAGLFEVDNTYDPLVFDFTLVSATVVKVWDGTAWVNRTIKRWDGSAWVDAIILRWSGSVWTAII